MHAGHCTQIIGGVMTQRHVANASLSLLGCVPFLIFPQVQAAVPKKFSLDCEDGTLIRVTELSAQSTHRSPLADLIEVRLKTPQSGSSRYRLLSVFPGDFGGRWVHTSPEGPNFSLILSGQSSIWYLDFDGNPSIRCARDQSNL